MPDDQSGTSQNTLTTLDELRGIFPEPTGQAAAKGLNKLDKHCRHFIAHSPFMVLGTVGDTSPKGDAPGFVSVLDDHTLLMPDRKGNNRIDSYQNIIEDPRISMIFFVPGVNETLRVNGRGEITTDAALLAPLLFQGRPPVTGLLLHIDEAFLHCAKALIRSHLWDADHHVADGTIPPAGRMMAEQIGSEPDEGERSYAASIRTAMEEEGRE